MRGNKACGPSLGSARTAAARQGYVKRCLASGRSVKIAPAHRLFVVTSWVALVVPGGGYGPLGAALRIPVLALEGAGAEAVVVSYPARSADPDEPWWSGLRDSVAR